MPSNEFIFKIDRVEVYQEQALHFILAEDFTYQNKTTKDIFIFFYNNPRLATYNWLLSFTGKIKYIGDLNGNAPHEPALANWDYDFIIERERESKTKRKQLICR